jgi:hypothetical protein
MVSADLAVPLGLLVNERFRRKSGVGTREWQVFVTRSCSEPLELLGERQLLIAGIFRLLFAHHMDQLDAT